MCLDVQVEVKTEDIRDYFPEIDIQTQLTIDSISAIHVLAPSHRKCPVVLLEDGGYKLKEFEWGVIADYMKTPEQVKQYRSSMCNARSEKILEDKRSAWYRMRKQRCLLPVKGIYEHREVKGMKNKVPYYVRLQGRDMFCIPAIYNYSPIPDVETGEIKGTFSIVTRAANKVMAQIHNGGPNAGRMPLFLPKELELQWLKPDLTDAEMAAILDYEMAAEAFDYYPVYTIRSTKPRPDGLEKNMIWNWEQLPPLGTDEIANQKSLF